MRAFVFAAVAIASIGAASANDMQVPKEKVEHGFILEIQYASERNEYMSPSTSITKIRGFRDRKTCWDHAAAIARAVRAAAKDANNRGRESFSCNPDSDFKRLTGAVGTQRRVVVGDKKAAALAEMLSRSVKENQKPNANFSIKKVEE